MSARARRRDRGFTLVELVISMVLSMMIVGVTVSAMLTSMNAADSTVEQIADSTDATLVSTYLIRDAQAAGGVDPTTGQLAANVGVSTSSSTTGWQGCQQSGTMVVRFSWYDRASATTATPVVVTYALSGSGVLTRRACEHGTTIDVVLGNHVSTAVASCAPDTSCAGQPASVSLDVTGSGERSPFSYRLTASLRGDVQTAPTTTNSAPVPLLVLGDAATVCPNLTISTTAAGTGVITVLGDAIVGDDCGSSPIAGDQTKLQPTGATSLIHGVVDPYASLVAPTFSCPAPGTTPGVNPPIGSAAPDPSGVTTYPSPVSISATDVVTFESGTHVFCSGVTVADGATVSGTGVLWYVHSGAVDIQAGAQVELDAPTTGALANVVLWQAGTQAPVTFETTERVPTLRGVVYAPRSSVAISGDAPINLGGIIARSVSTATSASVRLGMPIPYLQISPTTVPAAQAGVAYGPVTLAATGGTGTLTWSAVGLPAGMTLSPAGELGGNPTELGRFQVVVTVHDGSAAARSTTYLLDVRPQLLVTSPTSLTSGRVGIAYGPVTMTASGGLTPYSWSAAGLPAGMSMSPSGVLSGTPSASGSFTVVATVVDAGGGLATASLPLTIGAALAVSSPTSLTAGTVGTAYPSTTFVASGGTSPYSWTATGLPAGLALSTGGVLSGTPTMAGLYRLAVTVTDAAGTAVTAQLDLTVSSTTSPFQPVAAAQQFQVMVEQGATLGSSSTAGAIAVGGNLAIGSSQTVASGGTATFKTVSTGQGAGLLLGGSVDFSASGAANLVTVGTGFFHAGALGGGAIAVSGAQVHLGPADPAGSTAASSTPGVTVTAGQSDQNAYPVIAPNAFPFSTAFATFRVRSAELAGLTPNSCSSIAQASVSGSNLHLTSGKVNVWNTTVAAISSITSLAVDVSINANTALVINVTDAGSVTVPARSWSALATATRSAIIWNFPNATSLAMSGTVSGTVFAPNASTTLTGADVTGDVIAKQLTTTGGTLALAHFAITVPCGSTTLAVPQPSTLPVGTVGVAYPSTTLSGTGGVPSYSWSATGLPAGLSLSAAGVLTGTPTAAGTANVTVTITDVTGATATRSYTLPVTAPVTVTPTTLPSGQIGTPYATTTMAAAGGAGPYTWSASGLPAGLSLTAGGLLSGTPTAAGTSTVTITVTDSAGRTAAPTYSVVIAASTASAGCPTSVAGWRAEYWSNRTLYGTPTLCRDDTAIDFDWADRSPTTALPRDYFSVRWTKSMWFDAGSYSFEKGSDDGMRVYIDGVAIIDDWVDHSYDGGRWYLSRTMTSGYHTVVVEFYERGGLARAWFHVEQEVAATCPASVTGWRGEYFRTRDLTGLMKLCRDDAAINFDWASASPGTGVPADDFSVRWTKTATFDDGIYTFTKGSDDGMRVYIDGVAIVDDWREHSYDGNYQATTTVTSGTHTVVVEFYERGGLAKATFSWAKVGSTVCPTTFSGWKGEYYSNTTLSGTRMMCRDDAAIAFNWGSGSPAPGMPSDNFSVRWTKTAYFPGGNVVFTIGTDDGMRVWFDGYLSLDWWSDRSYYPYQATYYVAAGWHTIIVQYYEHGGTAQATLTW